MMARFILVVVSVLIASYSLWPAFSRASSSIPNEEKNNNTERSGIWGELSEGFDYTLRFLTYGTYQDVADSTQNPDNDFLQIPRYQAALDLRPDASLNFRRLDLSVKPRMNLEWMVWKDGTRKGDKDWEDDWFINEWLARIRITESLFISYGRENLQWGPSYLYSPSNPFFIDNGRSNPRLEVPGMDFSRLVWLPGTEWTISLIANLDEGQQELLSGDFQKTYALKLDYSGQEGYAGLILSYKEKDRGRLGAFGGWTATDALLLYGEGAISRGTSALYPVEDVTHPFGASMQALYDESSSLKGIVLVGGAYTLEAGPTITAEYLYNGLGYSNDQARAYYRLRKHASDAYNLAGPIQGLSRMTLGQTADPGLRFLRQNYVMLQYGHNDIFTMLNIIFRWIQNIDEGSGQFISIVDCSIGNHIQLFAIGGINSGRGDKEFSAILESHLMIGVEYTF